jgi:hypothetical protein
MSTTLLLLLSGALIGTGITLVWRDLHKKRRDGFILQRDQGTAAGPEPEVEITVSRRPAAPPEPAPPPARPLSPARAAPTPAPKADKPASPLAEQWTALQPTIGTAVEQVNAVLARAGVSIGPPGEPSWSLARDYGAHRRVLIAGESKAWLRLELGAGGQLHAGLKAHSEELAAMNASSSVPAHGLNVARASDLLSEILKPAAGFAMLTASGGNAEQRASELDWKAVAAVVAAALQAANGALAQAGARFVTAGDPSWDAETRRHRLTVAVQVFNNDVARMHIERIGQEMEVAVGVADARLADLGRRERVPVQGMTTHMLAELIASCAWPTIARFRSARGRSGVDVSG